MPRYKIYKSNCTRILILCYFYILESRTNVRRTQFYVSSVTVINNYIVLVDVNHSIQFLVWREADMSLTLLAKDYGSHICLSTGLLIDGNRLGMLVADIYSNLQLYQFNPR